MARQTHWLMGFNVFILQLDIRRNLDLLEYLMKKGMTLPDLTSVSGLPKKTLLHKLCEDTNNKGNIRILHFICGMVRSGKIFLYARCFHGILMPISWRHTAPFLSLYRGQNRFSLWQLQGGVLIIFIIFVIMLQYLSFLEIWGENWSGLDEIYGQETWPKLWLHSIPECLF